MPINDDDLDFKPNVNTLKNRVGVTRPYYDKLPKELRALAFYVADLEKMRQIESVRSSLERAIDKGLSFKDWQKTLNKDVLSRLTDARQELVFRTNLNSAYNQSTRVEAIENIDATPYLRYSAINDDRVRPSHLELDGIILPANDEFWDYNTAPLGYNCTASNQIVAGDFVKAYRGFYKGFMVSIKIKNKKTPIKLTLNHPIATVNGFVLAKDIKSGDKVFTNSSEIKKFNAAWNINNNNLRPTARNVFKSFVVHADAFFKSTSFNFNGDIEFMNKKIDVVASNRFLSGISKISDQNLFQKFFFKFTNNIFKIFFSRKRPINCGIHFNFLFSKNFFNKPFRNIKLFSYFSRSFFVILINVSGFFFNFFNIFSEKFLFGNRTARNSIKFKPINNRISTDPELLTKFENRKPLFESVDEIESVNFYFYVGWVYDFESSHDLVIADGLVTSNCRCAVIPIDEQTAKELRAEKGYKSPRTSSKEITAIKSSLGVRSNAKSFGDEGFTERQRIGNYSGLIKKTFEKEINSLPSKSPYKEKFKSSFEEISRKVAIWWNKEQNNFKGE